MTKEQKEILRRLRDYLELHPGQRFGQALFNLNINQFANMQDPIEAKHHMRDIYNDSDETILNRMK